MRKRILIIGAVVTALVVLVVAGVAFWGYRQVTGSLPQLDGQIACADLTAPVIVERDAMGIPTIRAANRLDLAFATGFVHGQDRFFQMDLLRRNSAGELAELVGSAALDHDREVRVNRFRDVARRVLEQGDSADRELLEVYAKGVNAGLASLRVKPFEYLLLGAEPAPWQPEDSGLVMFSMYLDLQSSQYRNERRRGIIHDVMGPEMLAFLCPRGTKWDAPIVGEAFSVPPVPDPEVFNVRNEEQVARHLLTPPSQLAEFDSFHVGSNNWAVGGTQTADGRAIVADDMHLAIRVPHIWYRASFVWPADDVQTTARPETSAEADAAEADSDEADSDEADSDEPTDDESADADNADQPANADQPVKADEPDVPMRRVTGVTVPGTPAMIVGSNGHVAWGFTNAEGDWADIVIVEVDPEDKNTYKTPDGSAQFERHKEVIKVKGGPAETVEVVSTIWGPVLDHDQAGRPLVLRWVAHDVDGVNLGLIKMEAAETMDEALRLANLSGSPAQNFMVADDQGSIAWTILGRIPRRVGFDGQLPTSWAEGAHRWDGYLEPDEYPRVVNPDNGKLWTANARVVGGDMLEIIGDSDYDLGARAQQIRDDLLAVEDATEADMLKIQLDDRAVFHEPWRALLLETLSEEAIAEDGRRKQLRAFVEDWGGHAAVDSVGFRAVRAFRRRLLSQIADVLVTPCKQVDSDFSIAGLDRTEGPVWSLVTERPHHMLDPRYATWDSLLLAAADGVIEEATEGGGKLGDYTWGAHNSTHIQHPLSRAVPALSGWLDMPARELAGDSSDMPRIQAPSSGASQRMAVSPGHEQDGYMHMPCGQSGHPLSPHYGDAHSAWEEGKPTPFLPGPAEHTLTLKPAA